jgi:hypothetical protein
MGVGSRAEGGLAIATEGVSVHTAEDSKESYALESVQLVASAASVSEDRSADDVEPLTEVQHGP